MVCLLAFSRLSPGRLQEVPHPLGDVATGNNRVTERHAVAVVARQKESGSLCLDAGHQVPIASITDIVLRYGARIKNTMLERWLSAHAEQHAQVFVNDCKQL